MIDIPVGYGYGNISELGAVGEDYGPGSGFGYLPGSGSVFGFKGRVASSTVNRMEGHGYYSGYDVGDGFGIYPECLVLKDCT